MSYFYGVFENENLNKAYELLETVTPLPFDCGKLCGGKCCQGGEGDGMLLFPGEERLFENEPGFKVYRDEKYGMPAVVCAGECSREKRPLSCRLFPYMLYASEKDGMPRLTVAPDIRALEFCRILSSRIEPDRDFMRRLRIIASLFRDDDTLYAYLKNLTDALTDF